MKTFNERFAEYFAGCGNTEQVAIFNEWAYGNGREPINLMRDFDEFFRGWSPFDIARQASADFNPNHDYFTFSGCANLESIENVAEWLEDYVDNMADYFEGNFYNLVTIIGECEACALHEEDEE